MPKVVIAAGGTAGHVVPALAVADALRARGADVEFAGGERAEAELVPAAGYPFHPLEVRGMDRDNPLRAVRALLLAAPAPSGWSPIDSGSRRITRATVASVARTRPPKTT
jgi:UDP-N-acetylglucosamine:LPS N-acetylglucosamine transferase